jgi:hypothetical protein
MATIEEPDRAMTQLYNLARGHALSQGRNYIALEDVPLVVKVVLSTASIEKVTAHRTMTELKALSLVDMKKESGATNSEYQITLDPEFDWFLAKEFLQLREGFVPSDNSEYLNKSKNGTEAVVDNEHEEKIPPSIQENDDSDSTTVTQDNDGTMEKEELEENLPLTTANLIPFNQQLEEKNTLTTPHCDYSEHEEKITNITQKINSGSEDNNNIQQQAEEKENSEVVGGNFSSSYKDKEPIFFDVFEELSKDNNDNNNGGLVDYENLRLRLISTGKFFAGDAVLIIDYMERTGQIEETGFHLYYRKHTDNGDGSKL